VDGAEHEAGSAERAAHAPVRRERHRPQQHGYNRRISNIGFYWAVNDYVSALVAGEWFSNNYTALEGSVTYRWLRQFLQGRLAVKQYWQHSGVRLRAAGS
jgi:hypothetical protein